VHPAALGFGGWEDLRQRLPEPQSPVGPGDILLPIVLKLTTPDPYDLTDVDLDEGKGIIAPWNEWSEVQRQCRSLALALIELAPG
jgi:hypothetical protein